MAVVRRCSGRQCLSDEEVAAVVEGQRHRGDRVCDRADIRRLPRGGCCAAAGVPHHPGCAASGQLIGHALHECAVDEVLRGGCHRGGDVVLVGLVGAGDQVDVRLPRARPHGHRLVPVLRVVGHVAGTQLGCGGRLRVADAHCLGAGGTGHHVDLGRCARGTGHRGHQRRREEGGGGHDPGRRPPSPTGVPRTPGGRRGPHRESFARAHVFLLLVAEIRSPADRWASGGVRGLDPPGTGLGSRGHNHAGKRRLADSAARMVRSRIGAVESR